jgi:hypothetical protein
MLQILANAVMAFNILEAADVGVRKVQAAIPDAAGSTKLNVVLGTIEGAIIVAEEAAVDFAAIKPALTGAINALVAGYKAEKNPAFVPAQEPTADSSPNAAAPAVEATAAAPGTTQTAPVAQAAPAAPTEAKVS